MHAGVTGQRSCRHQIIATQQGGDDSVAINFPDQSAVHKVDQAIFINSDACAEEENTLNIGPQGIIQLFVSVLTSQQTHKPGRDRWCVSNRVLLHLNLAMGSWRLLILAC